MPAAVAWRVPLDWAMTQNNLGTALWTLGERQRGAERLTQATAAYRNAITVWHQSDVPDEWATDAQQRVNEIEALIASRTAKR